MFTKFGCLRHPNLMPVGASPHHQKSYGRLPSSYAAAPATPAADIGGTPAPVPDADAPPLLRLHERCTTVKQPFSWPTAAAAIDSDSQAETGQPATPTASILEPAARGDTSASAPQASSISMFPQNSSASFSPVTCNGVSHAASPPRAASPGVGSSVSAPPRTTTATSSITIENDERCAETHPGSVCCTTTSVEKDATTSSCAVTLRTTVKLTDPRLHVAPDELEELAWLAARDAASAAMSYLNRHCTRLLEGREERHGFVCHMLRNGTVRDAQRMENGFGHVSYQVTLEDKTSGRRMRAAFKPRVEGDCEGWHRVPVEVAAYQLNLLLGMDVVPPAFMRGDCDVDWTHYPAGGAFIYWCGNARQLNSVSMGDWSVPGPVLLSDTRILDVLIQNSDRHAGHFLYAEHWADGEYTPAGPSPRIVNPQSGTQGQGRMQYGNSNGHNGQQRTSSHPHNQNKGHHPHPQQQQQHQAKAASADRQAHPSQQQPQPDNPQGHGPGLAHPTGGPAADLDSRSSPSSSAGAAAAAGSGMSYGDMAAPATLPPPPSSIWRGRMRPVLIDHAAGFRQDAFVCLDHENAFMTGPTRHISARTYLRLRFLDAPSLRAALGGIITEDEIAALLSRRDSILSFFDNLVAEQGYDSVVLEA